ncbi:MAG: 4-hydroxybutyryl-CoA dehydratase / vinylacetyl-CoA-Delta-isomerase [Archaeoglobaceae archaeon]|nr:4-hydroxybutyryl-CoA dehydratase / vinylacetyl-CoA-Delta-isomerase [Archaeoglobaceae archaeon]MDK2875667.1 4-hydroxybutyryl-CoA dehydratase / vinylacetyl-CoA-Delta-isomerase [Archaeoglobaceae archaeon]
MRTSEEYRQDLFKMKPNIYVRGKKVKRDSPELRGGINVISKTFDLVENPDFKDLLVTHSHLTGKKINRFTHINQSAEDLLKKQEMIRKCCQATGGCIQRCMGCDAINGLSVATFAADQEFGTDYHKRFIEYLKEFQNRDLVAACAQTDVKGDRSKRPHEQDDPDMYVRVVEERSDGIIVRGAKNCITMASIANEIIVVPTRAMTEKDKAYSVAFAVPGDAEGVKIIARTAHHRAPPEFNMPFSEIGDDENMVIFDDVFVPWDRVFLCGEHKQATMAAHLFALFHRHSYTGCKPAATDVKMGFGALIAEYNGVYDRHNIRERLVELAATAELVYAAGIASAVKGMKTPAGTFIPNEVYANVGRRHAGLNYYHDLEILAELAGGLPACLPFAEDYLNPETRPYIDKYIKRRSDIPPEKVYRCLYGISNILASSLGGTSAVAGVHGGGSPVMEDIAIMRSYDFEEKKKIAKYLVGIRD